MSIFYFVFFLLISDRPKAQQHDLSQDKNVRAHFNAGIQKDDWIKDGELNIGSCEKSSKSKENGTNNMIAVEKFTLM